MLWVTPMLNLILWVMYLVSAMTVVWGVCPIWGGWSTLSAEGKTITVISGAVCLISAYVLVTTCVMPL